MWWNHKLWLHTSCFSIRGLSLFHGVMVLLDSFSSIFWRQGIHWKQNHIEMLYFFSSFICVDLVKYNAFIQRSISEVQWCQFRVCNFKEVAHKTAAVCLNQCVHLLHEVPCLLWIIVVWMCFCALWRKW